MSVYTQLDQNQLEDLISRYDIPVLTSFTGIADGIENTNYLLTCGGPEDETKKYVLTIFEKIDINALKIYIKLMATLSKEGIPVPCALRQANGVYISLVEDKPYILCPLLEGKHIDKPGEDHCAQIGVALADVHSLSDSFDCSQLQTAKKHWWRYEGAALEAAMGPEHRILYESEIAFFDSIEEKIQHLPKGITHTDAFPDNVLFDHEFSEQELSGWLDWYDALNDYYIYDLAVIATSWCANEDGSLNEGKLDVLLKSYQMIRPLDELEQKLWPAMLRMAAFRFWVSRMVYVEEMTQANKLHELNPKKDPEEFFRILNQLQS